MMLEMVMVMTVCQVLANAQEVLFKCFHISHSTIQVEAIGTDDIDCQIDCIGDAEALLNQPETDEIQAPPPLPHNDSQHHHSHAVSRDASL